MKMSNVIMASSLIFFASEARAVKYVRENESCFPLSSVRYEAGVKGFNQGLSEEEFNQVIEAGSSVLGALVKKNLGKDLIIDKRWSDSTVEAFATRDEQNNAVVVMNGGLARHPLMTKEAFLLILCHEVGHHLGGAPKILRGNSGLRGWSSAEGQADYFATSKCMPLFYKAGVDTKIFDTDEDAGEYKLALSKCRDDACAKTTLAGLAASKFFASLVPGNIGPELNTFDKTKVSRTIYNHPNPQCRLDTYLSGANCDIGIELPFDIKDPKIGACNQDKGARPACWFQENNF